MKDKEYKEIELFSSASDYEILQVESILKDNKIPFVKTNDSIGSYMNLYMGSSIQEKKIFVSEESYDKAKDLILLFINTTSQEDNLGSEEYSDENLECSSNKDFAKYKHIIAFLFLGIPIITIIFMILFSIFN